jgi:hypothetical protein
MTMTSVRFAAAQPRVAETPNDKAARDVRNTVRRDTAITPSYVLVR